jgi:uncharacterized repeat protein (TIGR04138 family)
VAVGVGSALGLLLAWQALFVGLTHGMAACAVLCAGGVPIFLALIAAHELGHLVAGWAMGLPLVRFTAGPLVVVREGGRLRARLNTAWFQPAAFVVYAPAWSADGPLRWGVMVLGGPLSSLLLGVGCLGAASWLNPGPPAEIASRARFLFPGDLATANLNVAGILSLGMGLGTLVPGRAAGLRTDGGQLLDLWRLHKAARAIGCPVGAVLFVAAALAELCKRRRQLQGGPAGHVSAREFCDYLLVSRGEETAAILRACSLRRSEDVGRVLFGLVNAGLAGRRGSDSEADFQGLFDLESP